MLTSKFGINIGGGLYPTLVQEKEEIKLNREQFINVINVISIMKTLVIGIGFCNKITMQGFGQTWIDSWLDIQVYYPGIFSRHAMYLAVFFDLF